LCEHQVIEAIGAILEEKLAPVMDAIHNVEHENTILVKSLTVATERIEKFERHIKSENLIFVEIQSQSFAEAASQPPGKMVLPTQILKLIKTPKRRFSIS